MAEPVQPTEPVAPQDGSKTTVPQPTTPAANDESERLRQELAKAQMRANQLENEAAKRDKAEEEARRKQLEEQEEYKTLYQQRDAELKELRDKADREEREKTLRTISQEILKDYPKEVQEIAATAGISLADDSEASRTALKEKLDAVKERVGTPRSGGSSAPTNPYSPPQASPDKDKVVTVDPEIGGTPMAYASAKGDLRPAMEYIGKLDAVQEMKRMAGYKPRQ